MDQLPNKVFADGLLFSAQERKVSKISYMVIIRQYSTATTWKQSLNQKFGKM